METSFFRGLLQVRRDLESLFVSLQSSIDDSLIETGDGDIPGVDVTIGCTFDFLNGEIDWGYQTGDNSYSGAAYFHPEWFTCSLMGDTDCRECARDLLREIGNRIAELRSWSRSA
jgi:hypothetical protein